MLNKRNISHQILSGPDSQYKSAFHLLTFQLVYVSIEHIFPNKQVFSLVRQGLSVRAPSRWRMQFRGRGLQVPRGRPSRGAGKICRRAGTPPPHHPLSRIRKPSDGRPAFARDAGEAAWLPEVPRSRRRQAPRSRCRRPRA